MEGQPKKHKKRFWKKFHFPSALTLLFGLIAVVAVLTWVVPSGKYQVGENEAPVAGTYQEVDKSQTSDEGKTTDVRQGLWDIMAAPVSGFLDAADVIIFILVIGGFLAVEEKTGALQAGLGRVVRKLRRRTKWMIPILMTLFAIGGTTYGMQEETIAFYPLIIPLVILAGYDAMTAVMIIVYGSIIGVIGSTVNPFSTGIASGFADVSIGDGMIGRIVILALSLIAGIWFTMRHAAKVKKRNEELEKAEHGENNHEAHVSARELKAFREAKEEISHTRIPKYDTKRKAVTWIFGLTFLIMILTVIPWAGKFNITIFEDFTAWLYTIPVVGQLIAHVIPFGDWWFGEIATLFLISSIIIAVVFRMKESEFTETFVKGAMSLLGVALIVAVSRGISIVMADGMITDSIIHWGEQGLAGLSQSVFGIITYVFYLPLSILIPSTSGLATATMPILAPLADFAGVGRDLVVTAFQSSVGLVNMVAPTVGSLVGGLALAKVSYSAYLKKSWPLFIILAVISTVTIGVLAVL